MEFRGKTQRKKAIIYCRVSGPYDTRTASLESQEEACRALCEREGYEVHEVYVEKHTGKELWEREELTKARDAIKAGKAQALCVYDTDRLTRGGVAHLVVILDDLDKSNAQFLCVISPYDGSPEAQLIMYFKAYNAQSELLKIKDRTRRGVMDKVRNKKLIPGQGKAVYGYRIDKEAWRYVIHEEEAAIVREVFKRIAAGESTRHVAYDLTQRRITTPARSVGKNYKDNNVWCSSTISRMVKNQVYLGKYAYQRTAIVTEAGRRKQVKRKDTSDIIYLDGVVDQLISQESFDAANGALALNVGSYTRNLTYFILLRGMVWCEVCGKRMLPSFCGASSRKKKFMYFRCDSKRAKGQRCSGKPTNEEWLRVNAVKTISSWLNQKKFRDLAKQHRDELDQRVTKLEDEANHLRDKLNGIEKGRERLVTLMLKNLKDEDVFQRQLDDLRAQRDSLSALLDDRLQTLEAMKSAEIDYDTAEIVCNGMEGSLADYPPEVQRQYLQAMDVRFYANGKWARWTLPFYRGYLPLIGEETPSTVAVTSLPRRGVQVMQSASR